MLLLSRGLEVLLRIVAADSDRIHPGSLGKHDRNWRRQAGAPSPDRGHPAWSFREGPLSDMGQALSR